MAGFRTRSLTKQSTFRDATTGFPAKWRLRNERRNFILMKASLTESVKCFWLVESNFSRGVTNQKHHPDLGNDTSSVWNFCARFSDAIWRGKNWWHCKMYSAGQSYANNGDAKLTRWTRQLGRRYASALMSVCVSSDASGRKIFFFCYSLWQLCFVVHCCELWSFHYYINTVCFIILLFTCFTKFV